MCEENNYLFFQKYEEFEAMLNRIVSAMDPLLDRPPFNLAYLTGNKSILQKLRYHWANRDLKVMGTALLILDPLPLLQQGFKMLSELLSATNSYLLHFKRFQD